MATGGVSCTNLTGTVTFSPPLAKGGTSPETYRFSLTATGCTTTGSDVAQVVSGTAVTTVEVPTNGCASVLGRGPGKGTVITWTPSSIAPTTVSFSGSATGPNSAGDLGFAVPGPGGTATVTGSFAGADNGAHSTASAYTSFPESELRATCQGPGGLSSVTMTSGSVDLS
ncbi:MAG TPA: hypothetical protein VEI83_03570 [Acidimicrobiales bacterium]|nr:hypothetical protein [Acidimicrobiales bacterium]